MGKWDSIYFQARKEHFSIPRSFYKWKSELLLLGGEIYTSLFSQVQHLMTKVI